MQKENYDLRMGKVNLLFSSRHSQNVPLFIDSIFIYLVYFVKLSHSL